MSETFTLPSGKIVAEVLDANSVCGSGNLESPILIFNLLMNLRGSTIPRSCLDFRELRCRISPFDRSYIAASLPSLLRVQLYANQELPKHSLNLEVPLDRIRIASLNRMRNGGDVKLRLDFEMLADEMMGIGRCPGVPAYPIWGIKERHLMTARIQTVIPRSRWVEQILPAMEFGKIHILELPVI